MYLVSDDVFKLGGEAVDASNGQLRDPLVRLLRDVDRHFKPCRRVKFRKKNCPAVKTI